MIIGISGKKQSGKDTVCKIIQYLMMKKNIEKEGMRVKDAGYTKSSPTFSFDIFCNWSDDDRQQYSHWQRKLFADKLKDIVCLLINCTREQLEDNVFKETPLGEEWRRWRFINNMGIVPMHFYELFISKDEITKFLSHNKIHHMKIIDEVLTPRLLLQLIGTEAGRNIIHPNIWVNALMSEYKPIGGYGQARLTKGGIVPANPKFETIDVYPNWIITDVRFPNELKTTEDKGGIVIRVINPRIISTDTHLSETALDNHTFGTTLTNDDTIETLINKTRRILEIHKLL